MTYNKKEMAKYLEVKNDIESDGSKLLYVTLKTLSGKETVWVPEETQGSSWKDSFPKYFDKRQLTIKFLKSLIK